MGLQVQNNTAFAIHSNGVRAMRGQWLIEDQSTLQGGVRSDSQKGNNIFIQWKALNYHKVDSHLAIQHEMTHLVDSKGSFLKTTPQIFVGCIWIYYLLE